MSVCGRAIGTLERNEKLVRRLKHMIELREKYGKMRGYEFPYINANGHAFNMTSLLTNSVNGGH